ncbi:MAG: hypothetical protein J5663_07680 [Bacteroidaceae bacterium]|nr:hypothetical protein [Bacteroidaceae bacterium]
MDNTYYILSEQTEQNVEIERLHICTWEIPYETSYIEVGMEFPFNSFPENADFLNLYLAVPFLKKDKRNNIESLYKNLEDNDNCRFIFNDVINTRRNVGRDSRDGMIVEFYNRDDLTLLPFEEDIDDGYVCLKIRKPENHNGNIYVRALLKNEKDSIAIKKSGIAKTTYIYDIKVNETRNIPRNIYELKRNKNLVICNVRNLFCLHAVPDKFEFSFVDSSKLKNIRKLETSAFEKYLPQIEAIKNDCYNIMFLKDRKDEGVYSLFSICTEETIGSKQIAFALCANIFCSLLFAISSLRLTKDVNVFCLKQLPLEYYISIWVIGSFVCYLTIHSRKWQMILGSLLFIILGISYYYINMN